MAEKCRKEYCKKDSFSRGYCQHHYDKIRNSIGFEDVRIREDHGLIDTAEYNSWCSLKSRCINPKNGSYHNYGGRGIKVYTPWIKSFMAFYNYIGKKPSVNHSIDRIDVNGNYEPGNVRWADNTTQSRNTRHEKDTKSGFKGVTWLERDKRWLARITVAGKLIYVKSCKNLEEAIIARKEAEKKYWK